MKRVGYVYSEALLKASDALPSNKLRASLVHGLIEACGLFSEHGPLSQLDPVDVDDEQLNRFHDSDLVDALLASSHDHLSEEELEEMGLVDDCCVFDSMATYVRLVSGGSIAAAQALIQNHVDIAIHLNGGRHHAKRYRADGFCYVNDIVLAILELLDHYDRVLYVDLDVHHGDGVELAFAYSPRVMTCSFHHFKPGFFPGTGGSSKFVRPEKNLSINVPLLEGLDDETFSAILQKTVPLMVSSFQPSVVVLQCGADGLFEDPTKVWNLTEKSFRFATDLFRELNIPLMIFGGGGYNHVATAKCWTHVVARALEKELDDDVPEHDYFGEYGPDFVMRCEKGNMKNLNTHEYLNQIMSEIESLLLSMQREN